MGSKLIILWTLLLTIGALFNTALCQDLFQTRAIHTCITQTILKYI